MNESASILRSNGAKSNGLIARSAIVATSMIACLTLHELIHLLVGRMGGIPAAFTGLTSAGIPRGIDPHRYGALPLALMNGIAPLMTVVIGFAACCLLSRRRAALNSVRYFFAWWAIFGIPYFGVQMMLIVQDADYSGNGADSAAVAGYLHLPLSARAVIAGLGFVYYLVSALWVLDVIQATDGEIRHGGEPLQVAFWRYVAGVLLTAAAIAGIVSYIARASNGMKPGPGLGGAFVAWTAAAVAATDWKNPAVRATAGRWLLPGVIGTLALIPLDFVGKHGNDYASIWLVVLPPVFATAMLAGLISFAKQAPTSLRRK